MFSLLAQIPNFELFKFVSRAMAKLFTEAGKVKNVLSANAAIYAQVSKNIHETDFQYSSLKVDPFWVHLLHVSGVF